MIKLTSSIILVVPFFCLLLGYYYTKRSTFPYVFLMFIKKKFEVHCFCLHRMSKTMCVFIYLASRKSKSFAKHHIQTQMKFNEVFTKHYVLSLLLYNSDHFRCAVWSDSIALMRSPRSSRCISVHFICGHNSRSEVAQFSLLVQRRKLELSLGMLSCAQNVHVHTVPSRVVVALSNGHFDLDEQVLLCVDAIEILSFEYVQRKESSTFLSVGHVWLWCLWFVYFMSIFFFSWALKLDDIQRWRADPHDLVASRVNTIVRSDSTRAKLS